MSNDPYRAPGGPGDVDDLQFDRAEPAPPPAGVGEPVPVDSQTAVPPPGVTACAACGEPITDAYFEANGKVVCPRCRDAVLAVQASGTAVGRFGRALGFGLLAAIPGALAWYILERFNIIAALVTILMGWLVGGAVRYGSKNRGGVGYQILAVILTYFSIVLSQLPDLVGHVAKARAESEAPAAVLWVFAIGILLASPVLLAVSHVLNAIIIVVGLWQAWQMNRPARLTFNGPYRLATATGGMPPPPLPRA
jgi:hypothetical protein